MPAGQEPATWRFGDEYHEIITLRDGTCAELRVIKPEDRDKIQRGLANLSEHSRYLRFFTPKPSLSERELDYLTRIDGVNHFALVADRMKDDANRSEADTGYGVARFVRDRRNPEVAEAAIIVTDDSHHKGLGNALLGRLAEAAQERGISWFTCDILAGNEAMCGLLQGLFPRAHFDYTDDGIIEATMPLAANAAASPEDEYGDSVVPKTALSYVLKQAGQGLLDIRGRLRRLTATSEIPPAEPPAEPPESSKRDSGPAPK